MLNEEFKTRQQFIRSSNELNKGADVNSFIEGNKQRVEQSRKLEELSINSGMNFSGNVIRQNVLNASASTQTTLNNVVDTEIYREEPKEEPAKFNSNYNNSFANLNNQGRNIMSNANSNSMQNMNKFGNMNNFNNKNF